VARTQGPRGAECEVAPDDEHAAEDLHEHEDEPEPEPEHEVEDAYEPQQTLSPLGYSKQTPGSPPHVSSHRPATH